MPKTRVSSHSDYILANAGLCASSLPYVVQPNAYFTEGKSIGFGCCVLGGGFLFLICFVLFFKVRIPSWSCTQMINVKNQIQVRG